MDLPLPLSSEAVTEATTLKPIETKTNSSWKSPKEAICTTLSWMASARSGSKMKITTSESSKTAFSKAMDSWGTLPRRTGFLDTSRKEI